MRRFACISVGILLILSVGVQPFKLEQKESTTDWWPMHGHDLSHTRYSTSWAPNTNSTIWIYTTGNSVCSSPVVVDGKVYVGSGDYGVYCFNASTGALIWRYTTGHYVFGSAAVVDGKVYVGSADCKFYCLNASTGVHIWNYTTGGEVYSAPAVADDRVYVGSYDGKVYCLDSSTGAQIWNYTTGDIVESCPAVVGGRIYVGSYDGKVYCLDSLTGVQIWNYTTGDWVFSSPAVAGGKVFVGSYDYKVYCLNASTGASIWDYKTGRYVYSSPAVADGKVFVGSDDGKVYAFSGARVLVVPDDYPTIQEAINGANNGDTVFVRAGTYHEHVVVNKTVSLVGEDVSATIIDGNDTGHVVNVVSDNVDITGFTVRNGGARAQWPEPDAGICLNGTTGCVISENRIIDSGFSGISLLYSQYSRIVGNNVSGTEWGGIHMLGSSHNIVSRNAVDNTTHEYGVGINGHASSHYNTITENVISNSKYGMFYHDSRYNSICRNNISAISVEGIWLQDTVSHNIVAENNLTNCSVAIFLEGPNTNNTLSANFITGAEYGMKILNAQNNRIVNNTIVENRAGSDSWSAGIRLDSGLDTQIHSNTITGNNYGILLYSYSPRVSIYNNTVAGNEFGIRVASGGSGYLNVSDNVVMNNRGYGLGLTGFTSGSNNATIMRNLIMNNSDGIALGQYSNYNTISQNNISMNDCGLYIEYSTKNMIYSNNIVDNILQVNVTSPSANSWDNGYPSGGNYWSDYGGTDAYKGSNQNETGSDGIGDTAVVLGGNNTDRYPLMTPWIEDSSLIGDVNADGKVDMKDVGYVSRRFMCVPGDPLWDAAADFNSDGKINMVDIGTVARHFGESRS